MKKINKIILMGILLFIFTSDVEASTVTWEDITNKWKELFNEENKIIPTINKNILKITASTENNDTYITEFEHNSENNIINLKIIDKTNLSEKEKAYNAFYNNAFVNYMLLIISSLNTIDFDQIYDQLEDEKLQDYGIILEKGETITYKEITEMVDSEITINEINKFSIDLEKFETETTNLRGTYEEIKPNPTVSLTLEKANTTSLDLAVNVTNLNETSTASCEIYLIPDPNTGFPSGESKVIKTINDCKNGKNIFTVSNLSANTKYKFQVVLTEKMTILDDEINNQIVGEKYVTFSTIEQAKSNTENIITNPKTGSTSLYIIFGSLLVSSITLILYFKKMTKESL